MPESRLQQLKALGSRAQFDPKLFIKELYDKYLGAISEAAPKVSGGVWTVFDTFEDFLKETLNFIKVRMQEIKELRRNLDSVKPFPNLYKTGLIDIIEEPHPSLVLPVDSEELDMEEYILAMADKAIRDFLRGEIKLED